MFVNHPTDNDQHQSLDDLLRQERRLRLQMVFWYICFVLIALWWLTQMLVAVRICITQGCSTLIRVQPLRRMLPVTVTVRFYIGYGLFTLAAVLPLLVLWYREVRESLAEVRARRGFEEVMQRIRAGEDIDYIIQDLKRRQR